ncbi:MAG: TIGR00730 family Rossman fold protein [Verrucomicrobiota bacterium]|nr:TIGR00730 family Rossman fold protein [Verrucomicrobiota bacterium]
MIKPLKAYEDVDFLKEDACRSIRLQLEFLKTETRIAEHNIDSTIVIFGSARTLPEDIAQTRLRMAEKELKNSQNSVELQKLYNIAKRDFEASHYYELARSFSYLVTKESNTENEKEEYVVVTGGGGGIMEAGNRGAAEAGGKSIGLNITLPFEQKPNKYITEDLSFLFHYFSIRKIHFLLRAKALCAFPGGFGTLDELFETLTLVQTGKTSSMPIILFGKEFWEKLIDWHLLIKQGVISENDLELFSFCDDSEEAWDIIKDFWE